LNEKRLQILEKLKEQSYEGMIKLKSLITIMNLFVPKFLWDCITNEEISLFNTYVLDVTEKRDSFKEIKQAKKLQTGLFIMAKAFEKNYH